MKKFLKIIGILLGAVVILLGGYIVYLYASYHRIPDNHELEVEAPARFLYRGCQRESAENRYHLFRSYL